MSSEASPVLEVDRATVRFGGLTAVNEVSLQVGKGQIVAVIGPNGAGKTTLFNAIAGVTDVTSGSVRLGGRTLSREPSPRDRIRWFVTSLVSGVLLMVFVAGADSLWSATVKLNFTTRSAGFPAMEAVHDGVDYLTGQPVVQPRIGRFVVVTQSGATLGSAATKADARALRHRALADEPALVAEVTRIGRTNLLALLVGTALGFAGSLAIARQTRRTPAWIAQQGIARTFQNIRLFQEMTVLENVLVGMDRHIGRVTERALSDRGWTLAPLAALLGLLATGVALRVARGTSLATGLLVASLLLGLGAFVRIARLGAFSTGAKRDDDVARAKARELLAFVGLQDQAEVTSKNLPYGDQRRLEIARALATEPQLLLLDEPAAGMNPGETMALMTLIRAIRERGVTVLLIEHHMRVVMGISDRIAVLQYGRKIADGTPEEVRNDPHVIEAYLGKEELG